MEWEPVIGLEVHAQLLTRTKLFTSAPNAYGDAPNTHVDPVVLGLPGALPVLNQHAVELAIRAALALNCQIQERSIWARKQYFYPDLPKGYQISQYDKPYALNGWLDVPADDREIGGAAKRVRITRIHMEEDAGKLIHHGAGGRELSFVDLNRAGVPLVEIVSEPDIRDSAGAAAYMKLLRNILRTMGVCDGNMEEGNLRCDANVSIRPKGTEKFGTRVEIKNVNSFRFIERAIEFEIARQKDVLESGGVIVQETRRYDSERDVTFSMRGKEAAHDYRYFPDPDLVPLVIDSAWIDRVRRELPETPRDRAIRFSSQYGIPAYDATVLTQEKEIADYFEAVAGKPCNPKTASNWVMGEVLRLLKAENREIAACPVKPDALAELIGLVESSVINNNTAKEVFEEMFRNGESPAAIVDRKGLRQVSDTSAIEDIARRIVAANPKEAESYRGGKDKLLGFFVGQVMKELKGKGNPQVVNAAVLKVLKEG